LRFGLRCPTAQPLAPAGGDFGADCACRAHDRTTLCGECETFRLAIKITEQPRIKKRSGAAARREIIEPRDRGGLVAERIETAIATYFEITMVA